MTAPSFGTVIVAVDQLRADARSWSQAADEHASIAGWLAAASLVRLEFGPIGHLQDDFERARAVIEQNITAGGAAARSVSQTLSAAADAYLLDEIEHVHAIEHVW